MSGQLRALTLVSYANHKLNLHEDVLRKVLESAEARKRPVSVISIAGMFRKGKSFFLNFVLRYLKSKCSSDWMQSKMGPLDGFEWKPNVEGVTSGITIWPEVFVVNGVAIVLMDTQGLFDTSKSTAEDTYIMVLSSLFSSVLILNHQEILNSSDLKNFEYFAKYGMALASKTKNIKGFQNLMFLVRDWKHKSRHPYGLDGGNKYLREFLKTNINEELQTIHETLKHFEKFDCFLMPYPGETVAREEEFKGDIEQIETLFTDHIKDLVEHLIATVKPKELLGKKANGETLVQVMKNYVECLNSGDLPEPKSLIQLQMDILQNNAENECMMIYNDGMTEGTKGKLLSKSQMDKLHKECTTAALAVFENLPDFGNQTKIETAKSKCSQTIEASEYRSRMEEKVKSYTDKLLSDAEKECMRIYNDGMKNKTRDKILSQSQMDILHKECAAAALQVFDKLPDFGNQKQIETAKLNCCKALEAIEHHKAEMKAKMEALETIEHHKNEMKVKTEAYTDKLLNDAEKECMRIYNDFMKNETWDKILSKSQMDTLHKECAAAALHVFDKLPDFGNQKQIETAKLNCSKALEVIDHHKSHMETKLESHMEKQLREAGKECMNIYTKKMTERTKGQLLNKSQMEKLHKECSTAALRAFDNLPDFGKKNQIETAKSFCNETLEASGHKSTMEDKVRSKLQEIFEQSHHNYITRMEKYVEESKRLENFKQKASQCRETTITDFKRVTTFGDTENIQELITSLHKYMDIKYTECEAAFKNKKRGFASNLLSGIKSAATATAGVALGATGAVVGAAVTGAGLVTEGVENVVTLGHGGLGVGKAVREAGTEVTVEGAKMCVNDGSRLVGGSGNIL